MPGFSRLPFLERLADARSVLVAGAGGGFDPSAIQTRMEVSLLAEAMLQQSTRPREAIPV